MLRDYQQRAIDMLYQWFLDGNEGNPCLVLPTGAGKSHIIAALVKNALQQWPETRVLMLTNTKELIKQNAEKMRLHWPNAPLGIYSASLNRRCLEEPITFGGIGSLAKKAAQIGHIDLMIVDECDTINPKDEGQYRKLINDLTEINQNLRVIGLTGTPYKLGHGMIHEGDEALFSDLIEPVGILELIEKGYLSPLRSKHTGITISTEGVKKSGGEFIGSALEKMVDTDAYNLPIVSEIAARGLAENRKKWIVFCSGIDHSEHIRDLLKSHGIRAESVTGRTSSADRDRILKDFSDGKIQALCNMNILSVGFDEPGIDLISFLRPTMSARLYVQMAGRGLRTSPGKTDCLALDFAGVVATHGPITQVTPPKKSGKGSGPAPTKTCETCGEICHASVRQCGACGAQFPAPEEKPKDVHLRSDDIMGIEPTELKVTRWTWKKHKSRTSGAEMLMVKYYSGLASNPITEYHCIMHDSYAGTKARATVSNIAKKAGVTLSQSIDAQSIELNNGKHPSSVFYKKQGKFFNVSDRIWT